MCLVSFLRSARCVDGGKAGGRRRRSSSRREAQEDRKEENETNERNGSDSKLSSSFVGTDTPELFWSEPSLTLLYEAVKEYLELEGRIAVLNEKLGVAGDLLDIIHEHVDNAGMHRVVSLSEAKRKGFEKRWWKARNRSRERGDGRARETGPFQLYSRPQR